MLAHNGIIFPKRQLLGLRARIFLRDIEEAGISSADELDLDGCWLGHDRVLARTGYTKKRPQRAVVGGELPHHRPLVKLCHTPKGSKARESSRV